MTRRILPALVLLQLLAAAPAYTPAAQEQEAEAAWSRFLAAFKVAWYSTLQNVNFDARSIKVSSVDLLRRSAGALSALPMKQIAGNSLIVRRVEVVDNPDFQPPQGSTAPPGDWTFPRLMTRAFAVLGEPDPSHVEKYFQDWADRNAPMDARWSEASSSRALARIPLRLLAVVNRLDQGRLVNCPDKHVCGAEFRFVYAGMVPPPAPTHAIVSERSQDPYLTVSVEFVLPPLSRDQVVTLARSWMSLSLASIDTSVLTGLTRLVGAPAAVATTPRPIDLEKVLDSLFTLWSQPAGRVLRIRTSRLLGSPWEMVQYVADASKGLAQVPLDQETSADFGKCVQKGSALGRFIAAHKDEILDSTQNFSPAGACTGLAACRTYLLELKNKVLTLAPGVADPAKIEPLRYALSLDSCRGCHGMETRGQLPPAPPAGNFQTRTQFEHVKYRDAGKVAPLSRFLTGELDEPSFLPWPVTPNPVPRCNNGNRPPERYYNDLLRRLLFHLAVLIVPQNEWEDTFKRMQLTAFQTH